MDRTYESIQRNYYWPNLNKEVRQYVFTCDICQRTKASNHLPYGLLQPLPIPDKSWEQISMDFITQLPLTNDGYDAIFVCVDRFSKMAHFVPTHTTVTVQDTAKLYLDNIFRIHGLPKVIVSDRDSKFTSHFWTSLHKLLQTKLAMSSAYHPQTDGQTERTNRTLEQMLRTFINYKQDNWKELLPYVEFAYNDSVQASTKRTPFEVVYGDHPLRPTASLLTKSPSANDMKITIDSIVKEVKDRLVEAQIRQSEYANKKRDLIHFVIGEQVLVNADHIHQDWDKKRPTRKLGSKWIGPFSIERKISDTAYRLNLPKNMKIHPVFHVSALEKYRINSPKFSERSHIRPEPDIVDTVAEYEVEEIIDKRTVGNRVEYLVKWKGFPDYESTWEPEKHLENAKNVLEEYYRQH